MSELSLDKEGELSQGKLGGEDAEHIQYRLFCDFVCGTLPRFIKVSLR